MPSPAKSQKHAPVPHDWLAPETMVEVTMEDPGLVGSRYPARVLQVRAGKALVEFPAFDEDEQSEAKLKEWVACTLVAPPPPPSGADFVRRIKAGQPLDLWHEDGWWRVTVTGRGADAASPSRRRTTARSVPWMHRACDLGGSSSAPSGRWTTRCGRS